MKMIGIMTATGQGNLGDELILLCELLWLRTQTQSQICIYSHDISRTKVFLESQQVPLHGVIFRTYFPNNIRHKPFSNILCFFQSFFDALQMHICIIGGGWLLYDPKEQWGSGCHPVVLWKYRSRCLRWCFVRCAFVWLGVTTGRDLGGFFSDKDLILVRDQWSQEKVQKTGKSSALIPDTVWMYPANFSWSHTKDQIGLALRSATKIQPVIEHLSLFAQQHQKHLVWISHSLHPDDVSLDDHLYMQSVGIDATTTLTESLHAYQHIDLLVTNRFHGIVLALLYKIPVLPIATNAKIKWFCEEHNIKYIRPEEKKASDMVDDFLGQPDHYVYHRFEDKAGYCRELLNNNLGPCIKKEL